jgi:lysophospholipase L1-like esterase
LRSREVSSLDVFRENGVHTEDFELSSGKTAVRKWFKQVWLWALLSLVVLVLSEGGVRVFAMMSGELGDRLAGYIVTPETMPIESYGENGFRQKPNRTFTYRGGKIAHSNSQGYRGPLVSDVKGPDTYRIVLLGGSTTHGFGVNDEETIDAHLRRILSERYPGLRFEVVNLAYDGYDAYQLYQRMLSDGLRLNPDLVVVNSGINDVRNAHYPNLVFPDPRTNGWREVLAVLKQEEMNTRSVYRILKEHFYLVRLPAFLLKLYEEQQSVHVQRELITPNPQAADHFEQAVRGIVTLAESINAAVVLSTPASSLTSRYSPSDTSTLSYWVVDAATTQRYRDMLAVRLRRIVDELIGRSKSATYVSHQLPDRMFIDDCHLTSEGNFAEAQDFARAAEPFIELRFPEQTRRIS